MKVTEFKIKGPLLIEPQSFGDDRGFFVERYRQDLFCELGLPQFIQDNYSRSSQGVLRGLHFQYDLPQSKLITATSGTVFDVAVDLRHDSPTVGEHITVELHGDRPTWLWVPSGFAHGFQVLSAEGADIMYKVDAPYNSAGEGGIRWDDPSLKIQWPRGHSAMSSRDLSLLSYTLYKTEPRF